jgi:hypothetical protein
MPAITGTPSVASTVGTATSLTFSHTANGDTLYVAVAIDSITVTGTGVTYGGVALTFIGRTVGTSYTHEWWYISAPTSGAANIVASINGNVRIAAGARNVSGVDLDGIFRNLNSASGSSTAPSVNITSNVGDLVIDFVHTKVSSEVYTVGAGQTSNFAQNSVATTDIHAAGSNEAGAASVTMSWTLSVTGSWFISGISIPAVGTVPTLDLRVSQDAIETLIIPGSIDLRVSQNVIETLIIPNSIDLIVSQLVIETLETNFATLEIRTSQVVVETLLSNPPIITSTETTRFYIVVP